MLSLAKLSLLASDEKEHVIEDISNEIDSELELVAHQEDLPENVLVSYGYDVTRLGVLTPQELIKVFKVEIMLDDGAIKSPKLFWFYFNLSPIFFFFCSFIYARRMRISQR